MKKTIQWAVLLILFIAADQLTKFLAFRYLKGSRDLIVIPGVLQFHYLENRGAAFGMLDGNQILFILIAAIVFAGVCYFMTRIPGNRRFLPLRLSCAMIAAGALGNMIDRIVSGYVTDFIYFSLIDFPVFNLADCWICIGILWLIILLFTVYRNDEL